MLWWVLGAWTASGLAIPALWLLSMAGRRVIVRSPNDMEATGTPAPPTDRKRSVGNPGHIGRYLLAGLSAVGAVVLLLISSFSDPVSEVGNLCASFADAHVPASQPAVTTSLIQVKIAVQPACSRERRERLGRFFSRRGCSDGAEAAAVAGFG